MINQIITSSILILFVVFVSIAWEKRLNPCIKYSLWLLVAVKLLIPLPYFETSINIMNVVQQLDMEETELHSVVGTLDKSEDISEVGEPFDNIGKNISEDDGIADSSTSFINEAEKEAANRKKNIDIVLFCKVFGVLGMVICTAIFVGSNLHFYWRLKKNRTFVRKFRNRIDVFEADGILSPCLFGVIHPAIYLSKESQLTEEQIEYVSTHEYTHFRHGDYIWALVK